MPTEEQDRPGPAEEEGPAEDSGEDGDVQHEDDESEQSFPASDPPGNY